MFGSKLNYYSFSLQGEERIYCTSVFNDIPQEIYEWAERFGFIRKDDVPKCSGGRLLSDAEVKDRELFGAVQLD